YHLRRNYEEGRPWRRRLFLRLLTCALPLFIRRAGTVQGAVATWRHVVSEWRQVATAPCTVPARQNAKANGTGAIGLCQAARLFGFDVELYLCLLRTGNS